MKKVIGRLSILVLELNICKWDYINLNNVYKSEREVKITDYFRLGDITHNVADISKAKDILDFRHSVDLKEDLTQFYKWIQDQEYINSGYVKLSSDMEKSRMFI